MTMQMMTARRRAMLRNTAAACLLALATAGLSATAPPPALAQAQSSVQEVAALINDEPISTFDVQQRAKLLQISTQRPLNQALRDEALEQLIDELLKRQEARRLSIQVNDQEVNTALTNMAQRSNMGLQQFGTALAQIGINIRTLRQRIEAELAWRDVIRSRFGRSVRVREQDVDAALQTQGGGEASTRYEYQLQQVLLLVRGGTSSEAVRARIREADLIRDNFSSCTTLRSQIAGVRDAVINDMGTRTSDRLPADMREVLKNVPAGKASAPRATRQGIEVLAVCERKEVTDNEAARRTVENELLNQEFSMLARRHLRDLRQDAVIDRRN